MSAFSGRKRDGMNTSSGSVEEQGKAGGAVCPFADSAMPNRGGRGLGVFGTVTLSALVSAAVSVGALYVYDQRYAQKVVAFDLPGYVDAVRSEVGRGTMTEDQTAASLAQVDRLLSGVSANQVVLSRDVVLRNARELPLPTISVGAPTPPEQPPLSSRAGGPGASGAGIPAPGPAGGTR
jgi:hypothetical protein